MNLLNLSLGVTLLAGAVLGPSSVAHAADKYGAIAYSQNTRSYGWGKDFDSQRAAERGAMNRCRERANDCKVATWFRNGCGAVSVGGDGGWGSDWGANLRAAENKANHVCSGYSYNCRVVVSLCVSGY